MNNKEKKIIDVLRALKEDFGVNEIKAEFEGEGARLRELMRLKELTMLTGQDIVLKIGGAEAITDMYYAKAIGVRRIVAPMIESAFAMKKYLAALRKVYYDEFDDVVALINVETKTGYDNFNEMAESTLFSDVDGVVIGRVDLTHSFGMGFPDINSDYIFDVCNSIFKKTKSAGLDKTCTIGGVLGPESIDFFDKFESGLIDSYELRKAVFDTIPDWQSKAGKAIALGQDFERLWYENKADYYGHVTHDDEDYLKRIANPNAPD